MKLTLNDINQGYAACIKLKDEKLNIKTAYKLLKLANDLEEEFKQYENFVKEIVLKYCDKDEEGNPKKITTENGEEGISILEENQDILQKEINDLLNAEIDFKDYKFEFKDFENLSFSLTEIIGLVPFIKNEENE